MDSQWSDKLRKRMEDHKEPSPEGLWEKIELRLRKDKKRAFIIPVFLKRDKVSLWSKRIGAVAAVAIVIISIGHNNLNEKQEEHKLVSTQKFSNKQSETNIYSVANRNSHTENKLVAYYNNQNATRESYETEQIERESPIEKIMIPTIQPVEKRLYDKIEYKLSLSDSEYNEPTKDTSKKGVDVAKGMDYDSGSNQDSKMQKKWEMNAFASNLPTDIQEKYNGDRSLSSKALDVPSITVMSVPGEDPYTDIFISNMDKKTETSINHKLPLTGGISINYILYERCGLKSGVTYTMLSSQLRSGSDRYYYNSEQTLHYIGIPISIYYKMLKNRKTEIYLSGGGFVEKNISGKLSTNYITDNKIISSKEEKISVEQLQWSLNTSMGIQYNFSKRIGIYTEPGVSYYFKNESEIETIYKKTPVNFSLRFGLCFSFE